MVETARAAGILLGVVSQHRFDDASLFLSKALADGRLGKLLQCDCYVKWYRSAEYYSRPIKGSWQTEGGGALINQAIHQVDLLRWLAGPVSEVFGAWQLGALHKIESEDVVNAVVRYRQRRDGRDPGVDGVLARLSRAHGIPRHQGHGDHFRRQADRVGRAERFRRARAGDEGRRIRRVRPDGDFAGAVRAAVPRFRRGHPHRPEAEGAPAKKDIRRWRLWTRCIAHAARARKSFCRFREPRSGSGACRSPQILVEPPNHPHQHILLIGRLVGTGGLRSDKPPSPSSRPDRVSACQNS